MQRKKCSRCGKVKSIEAFYKHKRYKNGYCSRCKVCMNEINKIWRENNPEYYKEYSKNNLGKVREYKRKYYKNNEVKVKERSSEYRKNNPEKARKANKNWRKDNPEKVKERWEKYYSIPENRLNHRISTLIRKSLRRNKNGYHWEDLVNFNLQDLKQHLEKQFKKGMSWNEFFKGKIHIDHKIPVSFFKFNSYNDREFKQCWALCNLQPLWAKENWSKGAKLK